MSLNRIRKEIDNIDRELIKLLSQRMSLAIESKKFKQKIEDISREEEIYSNLRLLAQEYDLDYRYIRNIYEIIFREGKKRQKNEESIKNIDSI